MSEPRHPAEEPLYPDGHLGGLSREDLWFERERQRCLQDRALEAYDQQTAVRAGARALLCTEELIRRGLLAMGATALEAAS